ncbi:hypothetical protein QF001_000403 [Paraburkholderia youngii]
MQHGDNTGWQPDIDHIAHLWLWDLKRWQDIQRPGRGLTVMGPFAHRALEQLGQIGAMPAEGETDELPTNPSDHAARRLAAFERLRAITFDRLASADACVPRAQRGQGRRLRQGRVQRNVRHPEIIGNEMAGERRVRGVARFPKREFHRKMKSYR